MSQPTSIPDAVALLTGLKLEYARKSEEIWSRTLGTPYEDATGEHDRVVHALDIALKAIAGREKTTQQPASQSGPIQDNISLSSV